MGTQRATQGSQTSGATASAFTQTNPTTTSLNPSLIRARGHWRRLVRRITHLLRIRRRWAATGQALQSVSGLFTDLERIRGKLVRTKPADQPNRRQ
jgi:hypothetical protein